MILFRRPRWWDSSLYFSFFDFNVLSTTPDSLRTLPQALPYHESLMPFVRVKMRQNQKQSLPLVVFVVIGPFVSQEKKSTIRFPEFPSDPNACRACQTGRALSSVTGVIDTMYWVVSQVGIFYFSSPCITNTGLQRHHFSSLVTRVRGEARERLNQEHWHKHSGARR